MSKPSCTADTCGAQEHVGKKFNLEIPTDGYSCCPLSGKREGGREGERERGRESGRVGEGHKEKPNSECFTQKAASPGGSHVTCRSEGQREKRGEWASERVRDT